MATTTDQSVLQVIEDGYVIQFQTLLPTHFQSQSLFRDHSHENAVCQEIDYLVDLGAGELICSRIYRKEFLFPLLSYIEERGLTSDPRAQEFKQIHLMHQNLYGSSCFNYSRSRFCI